jgi:hypothetical protein
VVVIGLGDTERMRRGWEVGGEGMVGSSTAEHHSRLLNPRLCQSPAARATTWGWARERRTGRLAEAVPSPGDDCSIGLETQAVIPTSHDGNEVGVGPRNITLAAIVGSPGDDRSSRLEPEVVI